MIDLYRQKLNELEENAGIIIESEPFKKMIQIASDYGYSAKTSGAGYGDCGIALTKNETDKRTLQDAWIKNGLIALDIKVWDYDE